jgi:ABC-2 type transporter
MRILTFANRNFKEIIRDPLSIIFSIILPLFLLYIFKQFKIPNEVYNIENFTPGIIIFSLSFITMFTSSLVAKDRSTSLTTRLGVSSMKSIDYILGYSISVLPIVLIQNILFFMTAMLLGLNFSINIIYTILVSIPISLLFISLGILIGTITTEKSSSGVSSIVVQLVAFTSGMYFSTDMVGNTFSTICKILPFQSTLNITKSVLNNSYNNILTSTLIVVIYTIITIVLEIFLFKKKMISDSK